MILIFVQIILFVGISKSLQTVQQTKQLSHINKCTDILYLPMPKDIECNIKNSKGVEINPCFIEFNIFSNFIGQQQQFNTKYQYFSKLIYHQQYRSFKCHDSNPISLRPFQQKDEKEGNYRVNIFIKNPELLAKKLSLKDQQYQLKINQNKAQIKTDTYVGFVRAYETLIQSFNCPHKNIYKKKIANKNCKLKFLPIQIQDQPLYPFRSILIDTSRHFLPIKVIQQNIDALMYNKMNILHWHITDDDSFPICLSGELRELCEYGAFSSEQTYSVRQLEQLVYYAAIRGVLIVPQIDTPGHVGCWGLIPKFQSLVCKSLKGAKYQGVFDISKDKTYQLLKLIYQQILSIFPSKLIHLGGDQVNLNMKCMQNLTSFISQNKIQNNSKQLQMVYRKRLRKIIDDIDESREAIYWMRDQQILQPVKTTDIIQWWGKNSTFYPQFKDKNRIIVSHQNQFYIDTGAGSRFGTQYRYGKYFTWYDLYQSTSKMKKYAKSFYSYKSNPQKYILGVEATLWGEVSNQYSHHQKIWIRTSAVAEQLWRQQQMTAKPNFFFRMTKFQRLINYRGIPTAPGTCEQCQTSPQFC